MLELGAMPLDGTLPTETVADQLLAVVSAARGPLAQDGLHLAQGRHAHVGA